MPIAERALALVVNPDEVSAARFALARALWDSGRDRVTARSLAEQAVVGASDRAEIETWLAEHSAPQVARSGTTTPR